MKKYKLIKEYPQSPPVGTEFYEKRGYLHDVNTHCKFGPSRLLVSKEYWEEVVDKNYQILSFKDSIKCGVYSVKRLSDGVVFTVGDAVFNSGYPSWKIKEFNITGRDILLVISEDDSICPKFNDLKHTEKPKAEYEILSIESINKKMIINYSKIIKEVLKIVPIDLIKINAVRRLSDFVTFSIGDKTDVGKILDIDFPGLNINTLSFCRVKVDNNGHGWVDLKDVKHIKPVLVSKDGEEIFLGDTI